MDMSSISSYCSIRTRLRWWDVHRHVPPLSGVCVTFSPQWLKSGNCGGHNSAVTTRSWKNLMASLTGAVFFEVCTQPGVLFPCFHWVVCLLAWLAVFFPFLAAAAVVVAVFCCCCCCYVCVSEV